MASLYRTVLSLLVCVSVLACLVAGHPLQYHEGDNDQASTGHGHYPRVQIKVYRGPTKDHHFAPWGYWVKQPHDDHHHHE